jgi:hypothetical protein
MKMKQSTIIYILISIVLLAGIGFLIYRHYNKSTTISSPEYYMYDDNNDTSNDKSCFLMCTTNKYPYITSSKYNPTVVPTVVPTKIVVPIAPIISNEIPQAPIMNVPQSPIMNIPPATSINVPIAPPISSTNIPSSIPSPPPITQSDIKVKEPTPSDSRSALLQAIRNKESKLKKVESSSPSTSTNPLLEQIKAGTKLKSASNRNIKPNIPSTSGSLMDMLKSNPRFQNLNKQTNKSDDDDDWETFRYRRYKY